MKKRFAALAVALVMLALPALAQAETIRGFYLGAHGGLNLKMDRDYTYTDIFANGAPIYTHSAEAKIGWGAGLSLGYGFSGTRDWFAKPRIELELTWRRNAVDKIYHEGQNLLGYYGDVDLTSMATMANLLFDFDLGGRFFPYVGFGFGAATAWAEFDRDNSLYKIQDTAFAYQGKAGIGYILNEQISLFAEYTYIGSTDFKQDNREMDGMSDHSIMVGLRIGFGKSQSVPKEVPVSAPMTPPAEPVLINSFRVFFDHDSSRLDNAANAVIAQAVAEFNNTGTTRIDVTGHTDTTGNAQYNMALSQRRAEAVAQALVANGVPASSISDFAVGQTDLLVPTGDNVRERQNRNVYIYLYK